MSDSFCLRLDAQGRLDRNSIERYYKKNKVRRSFNRVLLDLLRLTAKNIEVHSALSK